MSSETAEDFEKYARDCVELARQPDMPAEVRKQLLQMAREWMQAEMAKEDATPTRVLDAVPASKLPPPSR